MNSLRIKLLSIALASSLSLVFVAHDSHAQVLNDAVAIGPVSKTASGFYMLGHRIPNASPAAEILAQVNEFDLVVVQGRVSNGKLIAADARVIGSFVPGSTNVYLKSVISNLDSTRALLRIGSLQVDVSQLLGNAASIDLAVGSVVELAGVLYSKDSMSASAITAGDRSITAGDCSITAGDRSITAGDRSITAGDRSITAGDRSITAGDRSITAGDRSITAGDRSITAGDDSITAGDDSQTTSGCSITAGDRSITAGDRSITAGDRSITAGDRSITAGDRSITAGDRSITAGDRSITAGDNQ